MHKPRILILRAIDDVAEVGAAIQARGGIAQCLPMHRVIPLAEPFTAPRTDAILATSAQVFHRQPPLPCHLLDFPLYCVGEKTGRAARSAGFVHIRCADHSAEHLLALLEAEKLTGKSLLYLAGAPRRPIIEDWAAQTGTQLQVTKRYHIEPILYQKAEFSNVAMTELAAVLHFSPESARRFVEEAKRHDALARLSKPLHACFSISVADALRTAFSPQFLSIDPVVAAAPSLEALLDAVFSTPAFQSGD